MLLTRDHQSTAFYLLPPRAWELGAGALLAILTRRGHIRQAGFAGAIGLVGLALTLAPMFLLDSSSAFPGWNAIAPVVGTLLLIAWGSAGVVGGVLSSRPFVEIGKISYSLYLWHWPLIVFWKAYSGNHLSAAEMVALGLVSCALAVASTYLIERPFRTREVLAISSPKVIFSGGAALVGLAGVGALAVAHALTLREFPMNVQKIAATADYRTWPDYSAQFRAGTCHIGQTEGGFEAFDRKRCTAYDPDRPNVLIIGDSHAAQFWGALAEAMPDANVMQATSSGCRALLGAGGRQRCTDLRKWVFTEFLPSHKVDLVILGGRWEESEMQFVAPTLAKLRAHAKKVVVIGPTVEYEGIFPEILARSELTGEEFDFAAARTPGREEMDELMRSAVVMAGVPYVDVLETECDAETCMLFAPDGVPMQFDYGHLTLSGARYVVNQHIKTFTGLVGSAPSPARPEGARQRLTDSSDPG